MDSSSQPADSVGAGRRWYQFSLRSLLLLTLVLAVVGSWLAVRMRQAQRNREVSALVAELQGLGVRVGVEHPERNWLDNLLDDPGDLRITSLFAHGFYGGNTAVDDAMLGRLRGQDHIQELRLESQWGITDDGLVHLEGLTNLKSLSLLDTQITDAGLLHLEGLTSLESLDLSCTQVTDAGLVHLERLTKLERLELGETHVTDAGLVHLAGLTAL